MCKSKWWLIADLSIISSKKNYAIAIIGIILNFIVIVTKYFTVTSFGLIFSRLLFVVLIFYSSTYVFE